MSRSSALTSPPSAPDGLAAVVGRANRQERIAGGGFLILGLAWLTYTRLYFWLHPRGLTFDPSAFMYLTGKPDPTCGLTRTFAWMWRGDLARAAAVYPLGPIIFGASLVLVVYSAAVLLGGRTLRLHLSRKVRRGVAIIALLAWALNWVSKLIWLGM